MLQIFIVICAVITFTVMAADPRPSQDQQSASTWQNQISRNHHRLLKNY